MTQSEALEQTITALDARLRPEHSALLEVGRGLADAVDGERLDAADQNRAVSAALWKQYRSAVESIVAIGSEVIAEDGEAALLKLVRPEVGHPSNAESEDVGTGAGGDIGAAGVPTDAVAATDRGRGPGAT